MNVVRTPCSVSIINPPVEFIDSWREYLIFSVIKRKVTTSGLNAMPASLRAARRWIFINLASVLSLRERAHVRASLPLQRTRGEGRGLLRDFQTGTETLCYRKWLIYSALFSPLNFSWASEIWSRSGALWRRLKKASLLLFFFFNFAAS